jgi:hypothetical protein
MMTETGGFPSDTVQLEDFYPEVKERLKLPNGVPSGIAAEFREAEQCSDAGCLRAAAALFRSVLDKTMKENGYKAVGSLKSQIDAAASDGVITAARKKKAHDDIRTLGNDVLHDEWEEISSEAVEAAHHYCQRILEDFYDDRPSVTELLISAGRLQASAVPLP